MIAGQTGGDMFEIRTVTPYPDEYNECTEVAKQEQDEDARPELAESVEGMENYDVIFLGYPNWWGDMPMAVYTFLESYDFPARRLCRSVLMKAAGFPPPKTALQSSVRTRKFWMGLRSEALWRRTPGKKQTRQL